MILASVSIRPAVGKMTVMTEVYSFSVLTHGGTMMSWMRQMKRKTREAQAT